MNCQTIQNKILSLTDPRTIPDSLREHIAGCEVCRAWSRQAGLLETLLEQLPVPPAPSKKRAELIDDLARLDPVIIRPTVVPSHKSLFSPILKFLQENRSVLGGLAAAVLVVLGGWWVLTRPGPSTTTPYVEAPRDPFLEKMVRWDLDLAKAGSPGEKLQVLDRMADGISNQARMLALVANADELGDLAKWFDKVVKDGLVYQADQAKKTSMNTPAQSAERKAQFDSLATKLADMADQAEKMVTGAVKEDAKPALQHIAKSAREGEKNLRAMTASR